MVRSTGRQRPASRSGARRSRGFTLVELLVVIAVIVVLTALLLPGLSEARAKARQTRCLSQMRQIAQAHRLYLQDWDEQFPGWWQGGPPRPEPFGPYRFWPELLQPYASQPALFRDPSASPAESMGQGAWLADYALLTWGPGGSGHLWDPYWRWAGPPLSLAQVLRPDETIALTEGYTTTKEIHGLVMRHSGGMNASFLDGHIRWITRDQAVEVTHDEQSGTDQRARYYFRYVAADW